jgi:hypothetical protein
MVKLLKFVEGSVLKEKYPTYIVQGKGIEKARFELARYRDKITLGPTALFPAK